VGCGANERRRRRHRLKVSENRLLSRIFGPKRGGSGWRLEKTV
jgi:hypothetical protein